MLLLIVVISVSGCTENADSSFQNTAEISADEISWFNEKMALGQDDITWLLSCEYDKPENISLEKVLVYAGFGTYMKDEKEFESLANLICCIPRNTMRIIISQVMLTFMSLKLPGEKSLATSMPFMMRTEEC